MSAVAHGFNPSLKFNGVGCDMPVITLANPVRPDCDRYLSDNGNEIDTKNTPIKRVIPLEEVRNHKGYWDLADLAEIFNHEIVEMDNGVWRWKRNLFIDWIYDHAGVYIPSAASDAADGVDIFVRGKNARASLSLNILVLDLHNGMFTMEEWMKFYMQMGISLSGYCEVFGQHEASEYELPGALDKESDEHYTQTVIDYMIVTHKGKVLKL